MSLKSLWHFFVLNQIMIFFSTLTKLFECLNKAIEMFIKAEVCVFVWGLKLKDHQLLIEERKCCFILLSQPFSAQDKT